MRLHHHPLAFRILLGLLATMALVSSSRRSGVAAEPGLVRIDVKIGKSPLIEVKEAFDRVSVTDPTIADVFVISPNQILISGKRTTANDCTPGASWSAGPWPSSW